MSSFCCYEITGMDFFVQIDRRYTWRVEKMVKGIIKKTDGSLKDKKEFLKPLFRILGMMYNGKRLVEKRRVKEMEKTCKKPWEYGPLAAAKGKPYLVTGDKPFFWLGDTAWLLFHNLKKEEVEVYLRNRAEKGYNVIQATLFHFVPCENAYGARGTYRMDGTHWYEKQGENWIACNPPKQ